MMALTLGPISTEVAADIDSNIPSGIPEYIDGAWDAELNWVELGLKAVEEVECVDLKIVGVCEDGEPLWSFRLPVQVIENVRNVGETMLEMPAENMLNYATYELYYQDVENYVRSVSSGSSGLISIAENQQRRAGLRVGSKNRLDFAQSHIYAMSTDYKPLILDFLPSACTDWIEYDPFRNDTYPEITYSRIPEFTEMAQLGASEVTPADCAMYNMSTGNTDPGLINISGSFGAGTALAAETCASAWGGKIFPLNAHTYSPHPYVGDALRSIKAIELASYLNYTVHSFNKSQDALIDYYNDSSCIQFGEKDHSKFGTESENKEQITHYVHYQRHYCCY